MTEQETLPETHDIEAMSRLMGYAEVKDGDEFSYVEVRGKRARLVVFWDDVHGSPPDCWAWALHTPDDGCSGPLDSVEELRELMRLID